MALPSRVSAALSDIFLPAHSIYNDLDSSLAEADADDPGAMPRSEPPSGERDPPSSSPGRLPTMFDDPFSSVAPSLLNAARPRAADPALAPPPHSESSAPCSPQRIAADESIPDIDRRLELDEQAQSDPFRVEPEAAAAPTSRSPRARSRSPPATASTYLPASTSPDRREARVPVSPASSTRTRSSQGAMGASRSAIGNRSLMGLMGGTRYDGGGFAFDGFGVDEEEEQEDQQEYRHGHAESHAEDAPRSSLSTRGCVLPSRRIKCSDRSLSGLCAGRSPTCAHSLHPFPRRHPPCPTLPARTKTMTKTRKVLPISPPGSPSSLQPRMLARETSLGAAGRSDPGTYRARAPSTWTRCHAETPGTVGREGRRAVSSALRTKPPSPTRTGHGEGPVSPR